MKFKFIIEFLSQIKILEKLLSTSFLKEVTFKVPFLKYNKDKFDSITILICSKIVSNVKASLYKFWLQLPIMSKIRFQKG